VALGDIGLVRELIELQAPLRSAPVAERRRQYDRAEQTFGGHNEPGKVIDANGCPAEWVRAQREPSQPVVLYIHGGGYSLGSTRSHRHLAAAIGHAADAAVLSIDYRLAPESPFPAAVEDATAATRWLLTQTHGPVILAGDSAGGGLVLATLISLRDSGERLPAAAVCMSPWLDLTCTADALTRIAARDPLLTRAELKRMADAYLRGADPQQPLASPIFADLAGLPPLLIQAGSDELLLDDARTLAEHARAHNVEITLEEWPNMIHVWQWYHPVLREGRDAITAIATFINRHSTQTSRKHSTATRAVPASLIQQAHLLIAPETTGHGFLSWVYQLNGPLDTQALAYAVDEVVERYEILRVQFERRSDRLYQIVTAFTPGMLSRVDLSTLNKKHGLERAVDDATSVYNSLWPTRDPRFRATLYTLDRKTSVLAMFVAEALVDSDSGSLLTAEISRAYAQHAGTTPPTGLPEVSDTSYLDYTESHAPDLTTITTSREFWARQEKQIATRPLWPTTAHSRRNGGALVTFKLTPQEWTSVAASAQQLTVTPYSLVLTCLQMALARVAMTTQLLVHAIVPQRCSIQAGLIGNHHSIARIATQLDLPATFQSTAEDTAIAVAEAIEHAILPVPLALAASANPARHQRYLPDIRFYMFASHHGPSFAGVRRRRFRLHSLPPAPLSLSTVSGPDNEQDFVLSSTTARETVLQHLAAHLRMTLAEAAQDLPRTPMRYRRTH